MLVEVWALQPGQLISLSGGVDRCSTACLGEILTDKASHSNFNNDRLAGLACVHCHRRPYDVLSAWSVV